jgi:hypothetical protein
MSNNVYGARERARLRMAAETLEADPGHVIVEIVGSRLADELRKALPDIDDVTIGRILIALTSDNAAIWKIMIEAGVRLPAVWQVLTITGLKMTESEWKE